jgi:ADP-ribose pyrophosphatase
MSSPLTLTQRTTKDIEVLKRDVLGQGWGTLERYHLKHRRFDDTWSDEIDRDLYTIGEVAAVLLYDPKHDTVLLTEQFRTCGLRYGEATWLVEIVAGLIDGDDAPQETARREAKEEAGCDVGKLVHISTNYSSPGGYGERMHLYAAGADLSEAGGFFGLAHEHEDIRALVVPFSDALAACDDGRIIDGKTLITLNWLARHKAKLA